MFCSQERFNRAVAIAVSLGAFLPLSLSCKRASPASDLADAEVRIGVGQIDISALIQNFTVESLGRVAEDGRMERRLAESWSLSDDRLSLTIQLRRGVTFHDGSKVTADLVAKALQQGLAQTMGPAAEDVSSITTLGDDKVEIELSRPSAFAVEALETPIHNVDKPQVGTGPFRVSSSSPEEILANDVYYLGHPTVSRVSFKSYPTVRAAWADLLRNRLDMIYEVGSDALNSLADSTTISLYPFTRRYQYLLQFNVQSPALASPELRRALNASVDREAFIRDALDGHGLVSSGPIWPKHWAAEGLRTDYARQDAIAALTHIGRVRFRCLVTPNDERLALVLKRQFDELGVDMILEELSPRDAQEAVAKGMFDAFLATAISGPSLLRPYDWWHSKGSRNRSRYANTNVDTALDSIRWAKSDEDYQHGVVALQREISTDPPAVFLAWDQRARAVSKRFVVPTVEPGVDIMGTLRSWRVAATDASETN